MLEASLVYLTSSLLNRFVPFLLLPLLTKYLSPSEYGVIAVIQVFLSLFLSFYGSLNSNITRKYFHLTGQQLSKYMFAIVIVLFSFLFMSVIISLVYLYSGFPLFGLGLGWYLVMPIIACMSMANLLNLTLLRVKEKPYKYAAWELSHAALNLLLSIILIVCLEGGWEGRAIGIMVPLLIYGILGLYALSKYGMLSVCWDWSDIKEIYRVSIPLIPHALAAVVITFSDRLFIQYFLGADAVGVYSVGYQMGMVVLLFTDAFLKAWQPWFYKKLASNNDADKFLIVKFTRRYLILLIAGTGIYSLSAIKILPLIVGDQYSSASSIIFPVALSYAAFDVYQIFFPYLIHTKKTDVLVVISPLSAFLNVILNALWIPVFGMVGAAYATIGAYLFSAFLVFLFSNKFYPMPWFSKYKLDE
ncbi:oligosaccharide flippase family protein [Pseudomonadales bacterium]|nr:oligosaccharide flippase family protein [Pseudomonadales bacterium]